ncbi:MAG TPA: hypothetical protein VM425_21060 [Myxococcota bacterium]|nr:hypothetical protein [Myxococcota bacterium]
MNRCLRLMVVAFVSFFAGCGSSGEPLFGGFIPSGGSATILAPTNCNISFVGDAAIAGIVIDLTSYAESCDVIDATQLCGNKADSTRVLGLVLSGEVGGASTDPVGAGTYRFQADPPSGVFTAAAGTAAQVDTLCQPQPGTSVAAMSGGSITISSVTETRVTGTANMRFDDGQAFDQPFDVAVCQVTLDLCSRFLPCGSHDCVQ